MKNNKGSLLFVVMLFPVVLITLSVSVQIASASIAKSRITTAESNYTYENNVLCNITINQFILQLEDYLQVVRYDSDLSSNDLYDQLITQLYNQIADDKGQAKYLSARQLLLESTFSNEDIYNLLSKRVEALNSSESILISPLVIDYLNENTVLNFQDGDILYLDPVQLEIILTSGGIQSRSVYTFTNLYAVVRYQDDVFIQLQLDSSELDIQRSDYTETRIAV